MLNGFEEFLITAVALFLLIVPPVDWTVFYYLRRASKKSGGIAVGERATVAGILACATTINAFLAIVRLSGARLPPEIGITLLLISLTLVSLPNIYWAITYVRARKSLERKIRNDETNS